MNLKIMMLARLVEIVQRNLYFYIQKNKQNDFMNI